MKVALAFEPVRRRPYVKVLDEVGRLASEVGVREVEVPLPDPEDEWGETEGLTHWIEGRELEPICLCLEMESIPSSAAAKRKVLDNLEKALELAQSIGVRVLTVRPVGTEEAAFEEVYGPAADLFLLAVSRAAEAGASIAMENSPACCRTSVNLRRLIDRVASPFFRASLDLAQFEQCGEDVLVAVQNLAPFAVHVRLSGPWASVEGEGPPPTLRGIAKALHIAGYKDHLAIVGREGQSVEELRKAKDLVEAAIRLASKGIS